MYILHSESLTFTDACGDEEMQLQPCAPSYRRLPVVSSISPYRREIWDVRERREIREIGGIREIREVREVRETREVRQILEIGMLFV